MKFGLSLKIDTRAQFKREVIMDLSTDLASFFSDRNYGNDILEYIIGIVCTLPPPGYEHLYKDTSPIYIDDKITTNRFTGDSYRMHKLYTYQIKLNFEEYNEFISLSYDESKKMMLNKISKSLINLDKLPKKIKDFNKQAFIEDFTSYYKNI